MCCVTVCRWQQSGRGRSCRPGALALWLSGPAYFGGGELLVAWSAGAAMRSFSHLFFDGGVSRSVMLSGNGGALQ